MAVDALVYHPTVAHYLRFVGTTVGRDKLLRTIQYFARFLSFYLLRKGYSAERIAIFNAIKAQLGLTRKLMRVGKNVEHFKAAGEIVDKKAMDPVIRYCAVGRQLGYGAYLTLDSFTYLDASGIYKSERLRSLQKAAQKAWLIGIVFSLVSGAYTLKGIADKAKTIDRKSGEGKVEAGRLLKAKQAASTQLVSDLADFCIPASGLGYLNLDDGFVGLAGMVSSIIGLKSAWSKTA